LSSSWGQSTSTEREKTYVLWGKVQLDDADLGGEQNGDKPGRGSENKVSIVVAASLDEAGHPIHVQVTKVETSVLQRSQTGLRTPWHIAPQGPSDT
jgi:hypothetical protein